MPVAIISPIRLQSRESRVQDVEPGCKKAGRAGAAAAEGGFAFACGCTKENADCGWLRSRTVTVKSLNNLAISSSLRSVIFARCSFCMIRIFCASNCDCVLCVGMSIATDAYDGGCSKRIVSAFGCNVRLLERVTTGSRARAPCVTSSNDIDLSSSLSSANSHSLVGVRQVIVTILYRSSLRSTAQTSIRNPRLLAATFSPFEKVSRSTQGKTQGFSEATNTSSSSYASDTPNNMATVDAPIVVSGIALFCELSLSSCRGCIFAEAVCPCDSLLRYRMKHINVYDNLKTYGDLRRDFEKFSSFGNKKALAKECFSTINPPLFNEDNNVRVLEKCVIPELHILQGFVNHLFWDGLVPLVGIDKALLWPKKLKLIAKNYHGRIFEGNACRKLLEKADDLLDIEIYGNGAGNCNNQYTFNTGLSISTRYNTRIMQSRYQHHVIILDSDEEEARDIPRQSKPIHPFFAPYRRVAPQRPRILSDVMLKTAKIRPLRVADARTSARTRPYVRRHSNPVAEANESPDIFGNLANLDNYPFRPAPTISQLARTHGGYLRGITRLFSGLGSPNDYIGVTITSDSLTNESLWLSFRPVRDFTAEDLWEVFFNAAQTVFWAMSIVSEADLTKEEMFTLLFCAVIATQGVEVYIARSNKLPF
ncbi:unnamed protein product, partial [Trichogramma brassicae]